MNGQSLGVVAAAVALFGAAVAIDLMQGPEVTSGVPDCGDAVDGCDVGSDAAVGDCQPEVTEVSGIAFEPDGDALKRGPVGVRFDWSGTCGEGTFFLASYAVDQDTRLYDGLDTTVAPGDGHSLGTISLPVCTFQVVFGIGATDPGGYPAEESVIRLVEGTGDCGPAEDPEEDEPTPSPSPSPTPSPSPEPADSPSPEPSPSPSPSPTEEPSPSPEPTEEPSPSPSPEPTEEPSPSPSPSPEPTEEPSPSPSLSPEPTEEPSPSPSPEPTEEPSPSPTEEP